MVANFTKIPYKVFPTSIHLSRWERNITMKHSIWISIGIGLVCCFFVMAALLGDVRVILLSVVVTACSMISVLGFMGVWGITYNMSTYIEVLLLIGESKFKNKMNLVIWTVLFSIAFEKELRVRCCNKYPFIFAVMLNWTGPD